MTTENAFASPQMIPTNGIELEVFVAGPDDGPPVIMCHGWPEHAFSWRHQVPVLSEAGYRVIVPNQRGYGRSSRPEAITDYDITALTGDLAGLLDHFGYQQALFVGHDWGAIVVWNMAMMHAARVAGVINLSVPFMDRGETEWVSFWESHLGQDFYIVHFNRQPGVADQAFDTHCEQFLRNLYRTDQWLEQPVELKGMPMIDMCTREDMPGRLLMSDAELDVFVDAFRHSGFSGGINWYRNFTRNWEILGNYEQRVTQPALCIFGQYDMVPKSDTLNRFVEQVETVDLECGHWIQQERPEQTNTAMLAWMQRHYPV